MQTSLNTNLQNFLFVTEGEKAEHLIIKTLLEAHYQVEYYKEGKTLRVKSDNKEFYIHFEKNTIAKDIHNKMKEDQLLQVFHHLQNLLPKT